MATETPNNKYKYNLVFDVKEEWYLPEFWPLVETTISNFKAFPYKDDDVIICTYPRSGTHMTWLLARYLLQGSTDPIKDCMEDFHLPPLGPINKEEGRRVLNTHFLPANFGDEFCMNGKHKFIHVSRNPKDAMVSVFHVIQMFKKSMPMIPDNWEEFVPFVLTTDVPQLDWFTHMKAWEEFVEKNPGAPVLDLKFEEIVRDPETAIKKMAKFLNVALSAKFLQDLVVASKFENMKDAPVSEVAKRYAAADSKNFSFYRKGKIGDWVNTFTVAQNEMFDAAYKEQMNESRVKIIFQ